ncbi:uncharacterized protein HGUI_02856 [Hanseniaspora guilliermondii]|uniref:Heat shock transcription factor n=1 Tax=Hanseniaspora guilliermondii TaxID=56406 RepID=A0A1L0B2G8_9ASCO|nr:uncharacterized protein HGUI_02856 [Hanseniaspora guilliermondii]
MNLSHNEDLIPDGENSEISFSPFLKAGNDDILHNNNDIDINEPITDKNMIVEEPSPENIDKNATPSSSELVRHSNKDLRTSVLKRSRKPSKRELLYNDPSNETRENMMKKQRPAFINKVWMMVNDEDTNDCIYWADDGHSFIISHQIDFVTKVLPKHFKHCKIASFIRQLNMYGWKKIQDARAPTQTDPNLESLQFYNQNFIRGKPELLDNITRHKSQSTSNSKSFSHGSEKQNLNSNDANNPINNFSWKMPQYMPLSTNLPTNHMNLIEGPNLVEENTQPNNKKNKAIALLKQNHNLAHIQNLDTSALLQEFETLKYNQLTMAEDLKRLANQNDVLWKQNIDARKRLQKQENALQQILKFMSNYFGPNVQRMLQSQDDINSGNVDDILEESDSNNNKKKNAAQREEFREDSTSKEINLGKGSTAQIQEIIDDALLDDNSNKDMNAPIIDEISPIQSIASSKKDQDSPIIQSVGSTHSQNKFTETPSFLLNNQDVPLSESNVFDVKNSNVGTIPELENYNTSLDDDHHNYNALLNNLQNNIKKQDDQLHGFSQFLSKLQKPNDSPMINTFDLNDYLKTNTLPNTPNNYNSRPSSTLLSRNSFDELNDIVGKRSLDYDDDEDSTRKKAKK